MCLRYQYYYIHSNFDRMYLFIVFFFGDNLGRTRAVVLIVSFVLDNLHHPSSSIIIHHHTSSSIIIHHHHPSSDCAGEKPRQGEHDGRPPVIRTYICMMTILGYHPLPTRYTCFHPSFFAPTTGHTPIFNSDEVHRAGGNRWRIFDALAKRAGLKLEPNSGALPDLNRT